MAAETNPDKPATDPLKYYCIIFLVMVAVLAVIYFKKSADRRALEVANAQARVWFDPNLPRNDRDDRPNDIPGLAFEVEQLVDNYVKAGGEDVGTISDARMKGYAQVSGLTEFGTVGNEQSDQKRSLGYTTLSRTFTYAPATLVELVKMAYNIDSSMRYRVMDLTWNLKRKSEGNATAPFNVFQKATIKVALRKAIPKSN